jgi:hypothetical protein
MQKPYASKCGEGKIKIDLFRDFLQKLTIFKSNEDQEDQTDELMILFWRYRVSVTMKV